MTQETPSNLLDRFGLKPSEPVPEVDSYAMQEGYLAFGISRKAWGGEPMINFINRRGDHHALSYSHLYGITFNPSLGIVIEFSDHLVMIQGRCLAGSYEKLVMQRVVFVAEADRATAALVADDEPVIVELRIEKKSREPEDIR